MNYVITIVNKIETIQSREFESFINNLDYSKDGFRNIILNTTGVILNSEKYKNCILRNTDIFLNYLKISFFIIDTCSLYLQNDDLIIINNFFGKSYSSNIFKFISENNSDLYLYSPNFTKECQYEDIVNLINYKKTLNLNITEAKCEHFISFEFIGGKYESIKTLLLLLNLELNKNSAHKINPECILTYAYFLLKKLYKINLITNLQSLP